MPTYPPILLWNPVSHRSNAWKYAHFRDAWCSPVLVLTAQVRKMCSERGSLLPEVTQRMAGVGGVGSGDVEFQADVGARLSARF